MALQRYFLSLKMLRKEFKLKTPVLFLVFNRLDTTKKVFAEIRKAKPKQLFIASDGPREDKIQEKEIVEKIRKYLLKNINWKCEVKTLFRNKNLGCKYAVSGAIDWFFENVDQGIILEDDCLPSQSFFRFCEEMLDKYKNNEKIMHISGTNVEELSESEYDYFFSDRFNVWGWATWRRAWKKYDVEIKNWKKTRCSFNLIRKLKQQRLIEKISSWRLYNLTYLGKIDTWDYQWDFCCLMNDGFCIIPKKNLITNLGFKKGTHTTNYIKSEKSIKKHELSFPIKKNNNIKKNNIYSNLYANFFLSKKIPSFLK